MPKAKGRGQAKPKGKAKPKAARRARATPASGAKAPAPGRTSSEAFDDTGYELLFLAMAHSRLGHSEEARRWLEKAARWMEQAPLPKTEQGMDNALYSWNRRLAHETLRREAETLVKSPKP